MDRTKDFLSLVNNATSTTLEEPSSFGVVSPFVGEQEAINQDLIDASRGVVELQQQMKASGIFDDRSGEISTMMHSVRQKIMDLSSRIDGLDKMVQSMTGRSPHDMVHHRNVVSGMRTRLAALTQQLKVLLEEHTNSLANLEKRRRMYTSKFHIDHDDEDLETGGGGGGGGLLTQQLQQRQSMYHHARAEAVEGVQRVVGEMAHLFTRVANLVAAQEEITVRIEDDMSSALHNIQQGEVHLFRYLKRVQNNRGLILRILCILITFIVFFVLFLT